ncbi:tRNA uridine-5-carboxymethylaminomethyl(34) synthesis GTPase MnmE [Lactovum miscens]|uniref:tRNA modification GTPase MnmE n=1 Tax=Lactovum miscens TaxID=190387 RepID=A0A841C6Y5_9LACT|nr:tRNA uridine-5-carboxymethylaminomethyl(34) synthesis GTPase MnmE [Lactovum miscens]MBB5887311.1 tRNA modification GTPase [Lactovum miscens]
MTLTQEFDTIAAISTPLGEGAISIVRLSGSDAVKIANQIFRGKNLENVVSHTINYGHIVDNGELVDEVMLTLMRAPKTFTREDVVEINTHGGIAVTQEILQTLLRSGARLAEPGEFTKRAFLNGRIDLAQAESVMDIIRAKTDKAASIAVKQLEGSLSNLIKDIRQEILVSLAEVEVNIDYPEYDDAEDITSSVLLDKVKHFQVLLSGLLSTAKRGKILREGLKTAIIGRPNVGKSSLLNQLIREEKAIVTDIAGTTRDIITEFVNIGGVPLELIDTAGIRETDNLVESIGVERSMKAMAEADLVLLVLNASEELTDQDKQLIEISSSSTRIILLNKTDLPQKLDEHDLPGDFIKISALRNENLDSVEGAINKIFFSGEIVAQDATTLSNSRHIALVEQALQNLSEAEDALVMSMPVDLAQVNVREAWENLGEIIGDNAPDELITQLFTQFCLGK